MKQMQDNLVQKAGPTDMVRHQLGEKGEVSAVSRDESKAESLDVDSVRKVTV